MILGLDIGNTSIVVGGLDESAIHFTAEFSTDPYKTSDEYAIMLKTVLEIQVWKRVKKPHIIIKFFSGGKFALL